MNGIAEYLNQDKEIQQLMHEVLYNVQLVNVSKNHNSALDAIEIAKSRGFISTNKTSTKPYQLIHLDTHIDMARRNVTIADISCWINKLAADGTINTIYWVLPDWTKNDEWRYTFWEDKKDDRVHRECLELFLDGPTEQTFYVNVESQQISFVKPREYNPPYNNGFTTVKFYKLTLDDLPPMPDLETIILDIDGDYFTNSGYDTFNEARYFPTLEELKLTYKKLFITLQRKEIRPKILLAAESPNFVPKNYELEIKVFLYTLVKQSGNGNLINELIVCRHHFAYKLIEGLNIMQIIWKICRHGTLFSESRRTVDIFLGPLLFDMKYLLVSEGHESLKEGLRNYKTRERILTLFGEYLGIHQITVLKDILMFVENKIFQRSNNIEDLEIKVTEKNKKYKQLLLARVKNLKT